MIRNFITHLQEILCLCESFPPPRSTSRYFYANEKYFYASKKYLHAKENRLLFAVEWKYDKSYVEK